MGDEGVTTSVSRREFLGGAATGATAAAGAGSAAAQDGERVIEMTDDLVFDPDEATIQPGTTVVWENVGTIPHSVTAYADEIPEAAEYFASGGFDSEEAAREAYPAEGAIGGGETYEHTFEVEGSYQYFCIPHETVGMVASLEVTAEAGGGDGGEVQPPIPDSAKTIGIATTAAMVLTLGLAYFFLKYGGDYGVE